MLERNIGRVKKCAFLETEAIGNHVGGERLKLRIEVARICIVETSRRGNFIFGIGEFLLQMQEVAGGLQSRIIFRHRKQTLECVGQHVFGLGMFGRGLGGEGRGAGLRDIGKHFFFMRCVGFHRLDDVWNQIITPLELHLDIRPRFIYAVSASHECVVCYDEPQREEDDDRQNDPKNGFQHNFVNRGWKSDEAIDYNREWNVKTY